MLTNDPRYIEVDYNSHPGFSMYAGECRTDASVLFEVMKEIDQSFTLAVNSPEALSKHFVYSYFSRQVDPLFRELEAGLLSTLRPTDFYYPIIPRAFALAKNLMFQEAAYKNEAKTLGAIPFSPERRGGLGASVKTDRCGFVLMPREEIAKLWSLLQPLCPQVLAARAKTPWEVARTSIPQQGPAWELLMDLLTSHGVFEGLSQMHDCRMQPLHASLVHSCPQEEWYKDCYADVGLANAQTTYMHFDGSFHVPKVIMYLSDVGLENGPFSVIPRSQDLMQSYCEVLLHKALDLVADDLLESMPEFEMHYRRIRYKVPALRKELMKLPNRFRGTSHFGEDVLDNTPLSRMLLNREVVCTSDKANCVVFDGAQNIHRGGIVQKGERWAMQLSYQRPGYTLDRRLFPKP